MNARNRVWLLLQCPAALLAGVAGCEKAPEPQEGSCGTRDVYEIDVANFHEFALDRRSITAKDADTGCVANWAYGQEDHEILFVSISQSDTGRYRLTYSEFEATADDPECESDWCYVEVPLVDRELTDSEIAAVREAFRGVRVYDSPSSGPGCESASNVCCAEFVWDDRVFTDRGDAELQWEDEERIILTLRRLRYGLLDDQSRQEITVRSVAGTYHELYNESASNLTVTVDGRMLADLDDGDSGRVTGGTAANKDGVVILYPDDAGPFCVCYKPERVLLERIDEDTIATSAEGELVLWRRGRVCLTYEDSGGLEPCDVKWVGGRIEVGIDDALDIFETRLGGIMEDPAAWKTDGFLDLSSREVFASAWCRNSNPKTVDILIGPRWTPGVGGNHVLIRIVQVEEKPIIAEATLIQAAYYYEECERSEYAFGYCERLLPAEGGRIVFAELSTTIGVDAVISGSFEFETAAGAVTGTFRAEGLNDGR